MLLPEDTFDETVLLSQGAEEVVSASKTYRMLIDDERILGTIDGREALEQMIYKNINTEPAYPIYANFGVKKSDLYGKPKPYAYMEITRRIEEVLSLDDRINAVHSFIYLEDLSQGDNLGFSFVVDSIYGEIQGKEVVSLGRRASL